MKYIALQDLQLKNFPAKQYLYATNQNSITVPRMRQTDDNS